MEYSRQTAIPSAYFFHFKTAVIYHFQLRDNWQRNNLLLKKQTNKLIICRMRILAQQWITYVIKFSLWKMKLSWKIKFECINIWIFARFSDVEKQRTKTNLSHIFVVASRFICSNYVAFDENISFCCINILQISASSNHTSNFRSAMNSFIIHSFTCSFFEQRFLFRGTVVFLPLLSFCFILCILYFNLFLWRLKRIKITCKVSQDSASCLPGSVTVATQAMLRQGRVS